MSYSRAESDNVGNHVEAFFDAIDPPVTKRKPAQAKTKKTPQPSESNSAKNDREPASESVSEK